LAVQLYGDVYFGSIFALNIFEIKKIKIKYGQSKNTKFPFRARVVRTKKIVRLLFSTHSTFKDFS
jgi:hypothetical protein